MTDKKEWDERYDEAWAWLQSLDDPEDGRDRQLFFHDKRDNINKIQEFFVASESASHHAQLVLVSRPHGHILMSQNEICANIARGDWEILTEEDAAEVSE